MDNSSQTSQESDFPKISGPATRALSHAGLFKLEQLTKVTEADLLKLHGLGPKAIRILNEVLKEKGLSFANKG
ncbi:DNA-directed RNA polymerase alpha subunit [Paenibacillus endophyticus]|uniref:DNA-directed RNA polymerase alpha subunit n=1 Tax=Paenibacillus endophyticus TaxID=1294268 RepID=A0A7W5GD71_9BACL|nr:DNA-binding protein [Paenibacillus endophyticus]MBB3155138.1 DNA-directed RNA polymerase alpha subunit [Paenibacillus endophyticus]